MQRFLREESHVLVDCVAGDIFIGAVVEGNEDVKEDCDKIRLLALFLISRGCMSAASVVCLALCSCFPGSRLSMLLSSTLYCREGPAGGLPDISSIPRHVIFLSTKRKGEQVNVERERKNSPTITTKVKI